MYSKKIEANKLFLDLIETLDWTWQAGEIAGHRQFIESVIKKAHSGSDLVGYLNYIHSDKIQVLGKKEIEYLIKDSQTETVRRLTRIIKLEPPVLVLADNQLEKAPFELSQMCEEANVPLFCTSQTASFTIDVLHDYLSRHFADRTSIHGVFMDILGLGVLITGESGIGKSELGLELITRGHGLVADDSVDFFRINQGIVEGSCSEILRNLLEVRGVGLLDIKAIFGEMSVRRRKKLHLIVNLLSKESENFERLPHKPLMQPILGLPIRKLSIIMSAGRNIAVLVEAAVRNTILQLRGIDTYKEFTERQSQLILANSNKIDN